LKLIITFLISYASLAGITPNRESLYNCVNYDNSKEVEGATIYKSNYGSSKEFYEIEVKTLKYGRQSSYFKKVNLVSKYDGKIQSYTTGSFRIKIDKVRKGIDGNFWAFARLPKHEIHSMDWSCKGSSKGYLQEKLSKASCIENICLGDDVMDNFGWSGFVQDLNVEERIVFVKMPRDGSIHEFPFEDMGKRSECFANYCEEEFAYYRGNEKVEIVSLYTNDMARIWSPSAQLMYITNIKFLTK